jgi:tripartite ATP-independent transporter DctM subunit
MTGSALADASGLGKMEIEAMKKEGYDDGFSCAITAASATIGPIFPPSIPLVMYAMFANCSVGALFLGGMIPAILVAIVLMIYVTIMSHLRDYPAAGKTPWKIFFQETLGAIPSLLTPVILLAGIYTGVMTPTEAGAIAGLYAIVISFFVYKALSWEGLWKIIKETVAGTGSVSLMIGAASVISYIVAREQIANNLGNFIIGLNLGKVGFLIIVNIIILFLGMFMDTSTIQLVFVPILIPVAAALGIDLIHFGLVVTLNMMIGLSTPPFGMLLFITANISDTPLSKVMKEILIPIIFLLAVLAFITFVPNSVLFLPKAIGMM